MALRVALLFLLLTVAASAGTGPPAATAQAEIAHLLSYLETSGCRFNRNGSWYDPKQARAHLESKSRYLTERGQIATAEDFIVKAATRSSATGMAYLVRCGTGPPEPSGDWLSAELARYRAAGATRP